MARVFPLLLTLFFALQSNAAEESKLQFSGFARIIAGYLDTDQAEFKGYDDSISFEPASLLGLQADYQLFDNLSFTGQVVGRAYDDADSGIEWLYLTWQPLNSLKVKVGKLRTPFFSLSDFIDVGYSYHWINPPQQVYNAYLFPTFEGIDATWVYSTDNFDFSVEAYFGRDEGDITNGAEVIEYEAKDLRGIIGRLNFSGMEFRASRYQGNVNLILPDVDAFAQLLAQSGFTASAATLSTDEAAYVRQFGFSYDSLNYFLRSEWIDIQTDAYIAPIIESYYLTAGYHLNPVTLHLTYAKGDTEPRTPVQEIPTGVTPQLDALAAGYSQVLDRFSQDNLDSWTIGARWDVRPNMALKIEWNKLKGEAGENSFYTIKDQTFDRKSNLYLLGLEWVF